jgi:RNA polymerase sigma-70 factor (ECF subfamily)
MTYRKVMEVTRQRLDTSAHGSARALSLDAPDPNTNSPLGASVPAVLDTPSEIVMADERWELLVQGLPPGHRRILELLRDGYTPADIIRMLPDINRKAIERLLDKLNRDLEAS